VLLLLFVCWVLWEKMKLIGEWVLSLLLHMNCFIILKIVFENLEDFEVKQEMNE
jgi:hypothetical protein